MILRKRSKLKIYSIKKPKKGEMLVFKIEGETDHDTVNEFSEKLNKAVSENRILIIANCDVEVKE